MPITEECLPSDTIPLNPIREQIPGREALPQRHIAIQITGIIIDDQWEILKTPLQYDLCLLQFLSVVSAEDHLSVECDKSMVLGDLTYKFTRRLAYKVKLHIVPKKPSSR